MARREWKGGGGTLLAGWRDGEGARRMNRDSERKRDRERKSDSELDRKTKYGTHEMVMTVVVGEKP